MSVPAGRWLATATFWTSASVIAATYVGLPALLLARGASAGVRSNRMPPR